MGGFLMGSPSGVGPNVEFWFEVTRAQALNLIAGNLVVKGAGYLIIDRTTVLYGDANNAFKPQGAFKTKNYLDVQVQDFVLYNIISDIYYYRHDNQGNICYCESGVVFPFNQKNIHNNYVYGKLTVKESDCEITGNFFYPFGSTSEVDAKFESYTGKFTQNTVYCQNFSIKNDFSFNSNKITCSNFSSLAFGSADPNFGLCFNNVFNVFGDILINGYYTNSIILSNTITSAYLEFLPDLSHLENNSILYNNLTAWSSIVIKAEIDILIYNLTINTDTLILIRDSLNNDCFFYGIQRSIGTIYRNASIYSDILDPTIRLLGIAGSNSGEELPISYLNVPASGTGDFFTGMNFVTKSKNIKITGSGMVMIFTKQISYANQFYSKKLLFFYFPTTNIQELEVIYNGFSYDLSNDSIYTIDSENFSSNSMNRTTFRNSGNINLVPPDITYPFSQLELQITNVFGNVSAIYNGNQMSGITSAYSSNSIMAIEFIARLGDFSDCYTWLGFSNKINNLPYTGIQNAISWYSYPLGAKWVPNFDTIATPAVVYSDPNPIASDLNYHSFIILHTNENWIFIYDGKIYHIFENIGLEYFVSKNARTESVGNATSLFISECNFQKA